MLHSNGMKIVTSYDKFVCTGRKLKLKLTKQELHFSFWPFFDHFFSRWIGTFSLVSSSIWLGDINFQILLHFGNTPLGIKPRDATPKIITWMILAPIKTHGVYCICSVFWRDQLAQCQTLFSQFKKLTPFKHLQTVWSNPQ